MSFGDRNSANGKIEIRVEVEGLSPDNYGNPVGGFRWVYDNNGEQKPDFGPIEQESYVSTGMRDQCTCVVIGADRRLSYQFGYSTRWTPSRSLCASSTNILSKMRLA